MRRKKGAEKLAPVSCAHVVAGDFQQKRTAPQGVDAAETVRFSWKVVGLQGQREHDVRISQAMLAWLLDAMDGVCRRPRYDEKHLATFL